MPLLGGPLVRRITFPDSPRVRFKAAFFALGFRFHIPLSKPAKQFLRAKNFQMADFLPMRRAYCFFLITFGFVLGCGQNNYKTAGFPGDQDRFLPSSRDYDQRERVDDSMNFSKGNFDPYDPDPDSFY